MIDAHVHLFPDEAHGRAWQAAAGFEPRHPGTEGDYLERMTAAGVERAVVLLFARAGRRLSALRGERDEVGSRDDLHERVGREIRDLNRWGCELGARDPRFIPFVGVDPAFCDMDNIGDELARAVADGARGVKIVPPDMQRYPDDPSLMPLYAACVELGLPVLSQSGGGGSVQPGARGPYGRPGEWVRVCGRFPQLRVILAHLGRGFPAELVQLVGRHTGVHTDLSLALGHPDDRHPVDLDAVARLVRRIGVDRVLFGTNYPICDPVEYRERLEQTRLSSSEKAAILTENAERILAG